MKKAVVVAASLGFLATLSGAPTADADSRFHGRGAGGRFGRSVPTHGRSFNTHGFGHKRFFPRHFVTFGVVVAPPVAVYSAPPVFYPPPLYYSAPAYVLPAPQSPPVYSHPAPPSPRVVEYPTGRYELRGDGVTTPYTWVWVPNPPPPPPPPPPAAPVPAPPAAAPTSSDVPPERRPHVYRWADEQGVVHWTDRLEAVPRRYRPEARRSAPS